MKGPTPLVMFIGILNATRYAVILEKWFITIHPKALPQGSSSTTGQ